MKKPNKTRTRPKTTARSKGQRRSNPILDMVNSLDESEVALLRQMVQRELGIDSEVSEDPVDLFREYLAERSEDGSDDDDRAELIAELVTTLDTLRVDASGGLREAREKIQAVYDLLDHAIESRSLHPVDIIMTGKILADAGWNVPDSLKRAVTDLLQTMPPGTQEIAGTDFVSSLSELAEQAGQNPFDMHEHLNSLLAGFPEDAGVLFLSTIVGSRKSVINQAVAGFVLHRDAAIARAAMEELAETARQMPVESLQIDRLVRMRPWLPAERQSQLDGAIRTMRLNALPPVEPRLSRIVKCYGSVCDGTGTRSLFATQRVGTRYRFIGLIMKVSGIADALIVPDLSKSEMDRIVREMKSSVPTTETDPAGVTRILELALADNFASATLPPFRLVEIAEEIGLGQLHPDYATPMDIFSRLLSDLPSGQTDRSAVAGANAEVLNNGFEYQWFEAGEAVDDLLYPVKGSRQRVAKFLNSYLPERRHFWARQCALSALALHGDEKTLFAPWRQLALVGREIASDIPLDRIPLMKQIAEVSVQVFESGM